MLLLETLMCNIEKLSLRFLRGVKHLKKKSVRNFLNFLIDFFDFFSLIFSTKCTWFFYPSASWIFKCIIFMYYIITIKSLCMGSRDVLLNLLLKKTTKKQTFYKESSSRQMRIKMLILCVWNHQNYIKMKKDRDKDDLGTC